MLTVLPSRQENYYDMAVKDETPTATKARLAKLAGSIGIDESKILDLLSLTGNNSGTKVTDLLKLQVKLGR